MARKRTRPTTGEPSATIVEKSFKIESFGYVVLAALLALTTFLPGEQNERSGIVHLPTILWLSASGVWMLYPLWRNKTFRVLKFTKLDLFVYAFFLWTGLSIFWSLLPGQGGSPRPCLNMLSVWLCLASAWFLLRQTLDNSRILLTLLGVMIAVLFSQSLLGVYQQFVEIPEILRQFERDPVGTVALADPSIEPGSPNWERLANRLRTAAPSGTYPLSNSLGGFIVCWLVFAIGIFLLRLSRTKKFGLPETVFAALLVVSFSCLLLTKCRSAFVASAFGFILLLSFFIYRNGPKLLHIERKTWKILTGFGILILIFVAIILSVSSGKTILNGAGKSLGFRLEYWEASINMIRDYPIFGCGSGNFKQTYTKYRLPYSSEEIADPHSFAVEIAATAGLPALLFFSVFLIGLLFAVWKRPSEENDLCSQSRFLPCCLPCYFGALIGCWFAFFFSFIGEAPMSIAAPLIASLCFPLSLWFFGKTVCVEDIEKNSLPILMGIALLVLLLHLSAAGGISVTSTALTFWFLAAGILSCQEEKRQDSGRQVGMSLRILYFVLLFFWGFAALFVNQLSCRPIVSASTFSVLLESEPNPLRRIALLRDAAKADPYSATFQERLAMKYFGAWSSTSDPQWEREMLAAQEDALRLNPRSGTLRFAFAERMDSAFQRTGNIKYRDWASQYYEEAIERYPNNARFHASWSLFLWQIGKQSESIRQRDLALALDDQMPHSDQKLSPDQKEKLEKTVQPKTP